MHSRWTVCQCRHRPPAACTPTSQQTWASRREVHGTTLLVARFGAQQMPKARTDGSKKHGNDSRDRGPSAWLALVRLAHGFSATLPCTGALSMSPASCSEPICVLRLDPAPSRPGQPPQRVRHHNVSVFSAATTLVKASKEYRGIYQLRIASVMIPSMARCDVTQDRTSPR